VLLKLSGILGVSVDYILNPDNQQPSTILIEDKTVTEKIHLMEQLENEDKNIIYKIMDTILTKKKFQHFFDQNIPAK
jgi:hypothetical protein